MLGQNRLHATTESQFAPEADPPQSLPSSPKKISDPREVPNRKISLGGFDDPLGNEPAPTKMLEPKTRNATIQSPFVP